MYRHKLLLIVGASGSGKTTIADALTEKYGFNSIESYTTRPMRYDGEKGHIFISKYSPKLLLSIVNSKLKWKWLDKFCYQLVDGAKVFYHGNYYFATKQQLLRNSLYVIDPQNAGKLKEAVKDYIDCHILYVAVDERERVARMQSRGEDYIQAKSRAEHDRKHFKDFEWDYKVRNTHSFEEETMPKVEEILKEIGMIL